MEIIFIALILGIIFFIITYLFIAVLHSFIEYKKTYSFVTENFFNFLIKNF